MLRSLLLELISPDPEVAVVDKFGEQSPPDVLLVSDADPEDETIPTAALRRAPFCRVVMLGCDGRRAFLWVLRPHRTALGEVSRDSLLAAMHGGEAGPA